MERFARLFQTFKRHTCDGLDMLTTCDLGHHAAETRMEVDLGSHYIGDDLAFAVDDGGRCFIA